MDTLEAINLYAEKHRMVKEYTIKAGHGDDCELNTSVLVVRRGIIDCALILHDDEIKAGFQIGARLFRPDILVLTRDGYSTKHKRKELSVIAVGKDGEILWKLYPYAVVGSLLLGNGFEVPDEMPFHDAEKASVEMRQMMTQEGTAAPLKMSQYWPDEERAQAEMDVVVAKGIAYSEASRAVNEVQLFAGSNQSGRIEILSKAGLPIMIG